MSRAARRAGVRDGAALFQSARGRIATGARQPPALLLRTSWQALGFAATGEISAVEVHIAAQLTFAGATLTASHLASSAGC